MCQPTYEIISPAAASSRDPTWLIDGIIWALIQTLFENQFSRVGIKNGSAHTRNAEVEIFVGNRNPRMFQKGRMLFGVVHLRTLLKKQMWTAHVQPFC